MITGARNADLPDTSRPPSMSFLLQPFFSFLLFLSFFFFLAIYRLFVLFIFVTNLYSLVPFMCSPPACPFLAKRIQKRREAQSGQYDDLDDAAQEVLEANRAERKLMEEEISELRARSVSLKACRVFSPTPLSLVVCRETLPRPSLRLWFHSFLNRPVFVPVGFFWQQERNLMDHIGYVS